MTLQDRAPEEAGTEHRQLEALARTKAPGLASEFLAYLRENRKWWLLPIVLVLLVLGGLMLAGGTGAAPFIYSLF